VRDWNALVRERIGSNGQDHEHLAECDEVVSELAGHLEDFCQVLQADGVGESEAIGRALDEVTDWPGLARRIRIARRGPAAAYTLNERSRQLWLPGLASLTAGNLLLMALSYASQGPAHLAERSTAWFPGLALMAAYMPWIAAQPLVGALGAWLSRRAGGGPATRLCAGLFPSFVMLGCWGLFVPFCAAIEKHSWAMRHPLYLALGAFAWVAPAMMGLLLGSLPFLASPHLFSMELPTESFRRV
jgi:hypothetical protein